MKSISKSALWLFGIFLLGWLVISLYGDNRQFTTTLYDDEDFVIGPPILDRGLTWDTLKWAFAADLMFESPNVEYYTPLTVITRLADHTLYGDWAGGHHLTSVLLHWLNCLLVLCFLYSATRRFGVSLFFAAIFAVHPLNVEAVCWLSARKDLLCATFALLTLIGYLAYARRPTRMRFFLFNLAFLAGLLSKPMLVTLPFVLLLLDWWPLGRWQRALGLKQASPDPGQGPGADAEATGVMARAQIILEKAPMMILVLLASLMAWLSQRDYGAMRSLDTYSLTVRVANAISSYGKYIVKFVWPRDLAIIYHLSNRVTSWGWVLFSALLLVVISALCLWQLRKRPYLFVGWAWFVGTLVPVIGLVQIGDGAMADRYTYLANLGLYLALGMLLAEGIDWAAARFKKTDAAPEAGGGLTSVEWRIGAGAVCLGGLALGLLMFAAEKQTASWMDSITLFERARQVSPESPAVHLNLASAYLRVGRLPEAEKELSLAVKLEPRSYMAHYNLGVIFERRRDYASAMEAFREAGRLNPQSPQVIQSLIRTLLTLGRNNEAHSLMTYALKNLPANPDTMRELAAMSLALGSVREAQSLLLQADQISPPSPESLNLMGYTYMADEKRTLAEQCFRRAIDAFPKDARGYLSLSQLYLQDNRMEEARVVLEEGLGRAWDRERLRDRLANLPKTPPAHTTQ